MRLCSLSICTLGLMVCLGCNEVISTTGQPIAIDVVGDPSDPVSESTEQPDIVGFTVPSPELGPATGDPVRLSAKLPSIEGEPSAEVDRGPEVSRGPADAKTVPHSPARIGLNEPK